MWLVRVSIRLWRQYTESSHCGYIAQIYTLRLGQRPPLDNIWFMDTHYIMLPGQVIGEVASFAITVRQDIVYAIRPRYFRQLPETHHQQV